MRKTLRKTPETTPGLQALAGVLKPGFLGLYFKISIYFTDAERFAG